jgi:hypothetical protein
MLTEALPAVPAVVVRVAVRCISVHVEVVASRLQYHISRVVVLAGKTH